MSDSEEPKIIVDDDWKEQVQKEKEELQKASEPEEVESTIPPASFSVLVSTLSTQAMASLGFIPDPSGKPNVNKELAKHFIDTLGVLEAKTKGNLTDEEGSLLTDALHQLRMAFVSVPGAGSDSDNDDTGNSGSSIELP